jgi:hypothetical protein
LVDVAISLDLSEVLAFASWHPEREVIRDIITTMSNTLRNLFIFFPQKFE